MSEETAEKRLRDCLLDGVAIDIFLAEEAETLAREIGEHVDKIDEAGFGLLFGSFQLTLSDRQTLLVTRLFEPANPRYSIRSIPTVLQLLEAHADEWTLPRRSSLEQWLVDNGRTEKDLGQLDNVELTRTAISALKDSMPDLKRIELRSLSYSLNALRFSRDKTIAHNEALGSSGRLTPTWGDATSLTAYAKRFVWVVAYAYLDISFGGHEGDYSLTRHASRASLELRRLLRTANIIT